VRCTCTHVRVQRRPAPWGPDASFLMPPSGASYSAGGPVHGPELGDRDRGNQGLEPMSFYHLSERGGKKSQKQRARGLRRRSISSVRQGPGSCSAGPWQLRTRTRGRARSEDRPRGPRDGPFHVLQPARRGRDEPAQAQAVCLSHRHGSGQLQPSARTRCQRTRRVCGCLTGARHDCWLRWCAVWDRHHLPAGL